MTSTKPQSGIETLRGACALASNCREGFLARFTTAEIIALYTAYRQCGHDIAPDTWTEHQVERALLGETDLFTNDGEPLVKWHYVYGSGSPGCLYDNGPHRTETLRDAVDDAMSVFSDVWDEYPSMAESCEAALLEGGLFHLGYASEMAGAAYIEVSRVPGPMPAEDE